MNNEQTVALSKVVKDKAYKAASAALDVGGYTVDFLVRIRGTFEKMPDVVDKLQPNKIKWIRLFTRLACKVNKETLAATVREYLADEADPEFDKTVDETKDFVQATVDEIKGLNKVNASGQVRSTLLAEEVQINVAPVAVPASDAQVVSK